MLMIFKIEKICPLLCFFFFFLLSYSEFSKQKLRIFQEREREEYIDKKEKNNRKRINAKIKK